MAVRPAIRTAAMDRCPFQTGGLGSRFWRPHRTGPAMGRPAVFSSMGFREGDSANRCQSRWRASRQWVRAANLPCAFPNKGLRTSIPTASSQHIQEIRLPWAGSPFEGNSHWVIAGATGRNPTTVAHAQLLGQSHKDGPSLGWPREWLVGDFPCWGSSGVAVDDRAEIGLPASADLAPFV